MQITGRRKGARGVARTINDNSISHSNSTLEGRCFLSILDFQPIDLEHSLSLAASLKLQRPLGKEAPTSAALQGTYVALLFEKPSLRTRSTFEISIRELGGNFIDPSADVALGKRESLGDVGRSLERWVAGAVVRTYEQTRLTDLALATSNFRVINALSNEEHPCQALADCLTLQERWGKTSGRTVAFVGDGNNVATSFAQAVTMLGIHVNIASPDGFELPANVDEDVARVAQQGAELTRYKNPVEAVQNVDAIYTDVWTSMGKEAEVAERRKLFAPYQVNDELMERVVGQAVLYYPVDLEHTNFHSLYNEAIVKSFLPPVQIYALIEFQGQETKTDKHGIDKIVKITVHFHKRRLTEDQNLFVREGDFIAYGENYYEIVSLKEPKEMFGQADKRVEIAAECIKSREGTFDGT